jgi:hypothetical protein
MLACIGGAYDRLYFRVEMFGDGLDPASVSSRLGRRPTKAWRKGDETPGGAQYRKTGGWVFETGPLKGLSRESGATRLERWLAALPRSPRTWAALRRAYGARVRIAAYTDRWNAELLVTPRAAKALAARGLPLVVDPYISLDDGA